jgi:hypothetical protein
VIEESSKRMTALNTARFELIHEAGGSSQLFPGVELQRVKGLVHMPDRFAVEAEAVSLFPRSFIEIDVVVSGDQALMTDLLNRDRWIRLPAQGLPFNFSNLGRTLSDIMLSMDNLSFSGGDTVDGVVSRRLKGSVTSDQLGALVPAADAGFQLAMDLWIGQGEPLLRKVRIQGQILSTDRPELVRVLHIWDFDEPVEIVLPRT